MKQHYITLPNRRRVTVGEYVRSWRKLLTLPPETEVANWRWYPVEAKDVLRDMREAIHDRINRRGGIVMRTIRDNRLHRLLCEHVPCHCRNCGQKLASYLCKDRRFCTSTCQREFYA